MQRTASMALHQVRILIRNKHDTMFHLPVAELNRCS